jgi:hypothetical protein
MSRYLRDELVKAFSADKVLLILGAGVTISATAGDRVASWVGLIESGVERVEDLRSDLPEGWGNDVRQSLEAAHAEDLIIAADKVTSELKSIPGGHFGKWLKDTIGGLKVRDSSLLQSIVDLGAPICTTNYDTLVDDFTGAQPVTWQNVGQVQEAIRGARKSVVHLHGVWSQSDSIVFGNASYSEIVNDASAQALIRALATFHSVVFVGMGEGLADPNFIGLTSWLTEVLPDNISPPLVLLHEAEVRRSYTRLTEKGMLPLSYGAGHSDLALYLADVAKEARMVGGDDARYFTWEEISGYLGRLFGRIHRDFRPDIVLTMSGPGNYAASYCLKNDVNDTPLLCSVTFPKRAEPAESLLRFKAMAETAEWLHLETTKWHVFVPDIIEHLPPNARVLILDDRVISGEAQRELARILVRRGYNVKRAALVVHPAAEREVDYFELRLDGAYYFPWGSKYGRSVNTGSAA